MKTVEITAAVTGVGGKRAVAAVKRLVGQHHPDVVVFIGFAGGLNPALMAGDVLSVGRVQDEHGNAIELERSAISDDARSLITVDHLVHSQQAKAQLFDRHGCDAADMETYPVAQLLKKLGIRLFVLRAVCDPASMSLPAQAIGWVTPQGRAKPVTAACYAATHPWRVPALLHLKRNAQMAANHLARQVEATIQAISQG